MTKLSTIDAFGDVDAANTLTIRRLMPGSVERVWAYLTESELRAKWLASGEMAMKVGAPFELVWRNSELTDPPGERPEGFSGEHRMESRIVELDPPRKLVIAWSGAGDVSFELRPEGEGVLLTVTHRRIPERAMRLMIGAGWHSHLDVLVARVAGAQPAPFWDCWTRLRKEYDARMPG
ncbi:MAG: SRPBCC family protein [Paracoccaceae bacterium]